MTPTIRHGCYVTQQDVLNYFTQRRLPPVGSREIEEEEAEAFAEDPTLLVGKHFVWYGADNQEIDFVVLRVGRSAAGRWVELQHEDCVPVKMGELEMDDMLEDSFIID
ncbi:hypothetical protein SCP_0607860 [Sparassis crispa]|uniref:Uncharacterized protein n=1 Tax=Sparassis crispa TaxID=139825 RepID=A0A401GRG6_9APHY|nr:hypothetical protein SCP_0607860 [Sparassis crispa]GBE84806.1 hypothetical protein SCP_0607860 [Sparassis crispa]